MTYLVTGAVTGDKSESTMHRIKRTYATKGLMVRRTCRLFKSANCLNIYVSGMPWVLELAFDRVPVYRIR